ncbi:MAG: response regulator [Deltaproteobacteria bacterium]|nr:response regulator [Deltaproteobacteria bacterium]RJQ86684.1 MAG: response regulator [Desulfobacteraceae bacterium]
MSEKLRVLIVDDDRRMTHTLADILTASGCRPGEAWSAEQALEMVDSEVFDCILSDIRMPGLSGVELHREVRRILPGVPVLLMTAYAAEYHISQGLEEGVIGVLDKPIDIRLLIELLATLNRMRTVAVVDDDPDFCRTMGEILAYRGFQVTTISDPHAAVEQMAGEANFLLLDMKLNDISGFDVLRKIRGRYPALPVVLITGHRQEMAPVVRQALGLGACTCLYKPLVVAELLGKLGDIRAEQLKGILRTR